MVKKIYIFIIFCFVNSFCISSPIDDEDFRLDSTNIYLVHASNYLIENSTAIAGGAVLDPESKKSFLLPRDTCMEVRKTLHHCMGGLVPSDAMGSALNVLGANIPVSVEGHDNTPYAYLDLMSSFLDRNEVFAGQVNDIFTTSHTYGRGSIVVIPVNEEERFIERNPMYEGELVLYNPDSQKIGTTIEEILTNKNATKISLTERKINQTSHSSISNYNQIEINGRNAHESVVENFFQGHKIHSINHNKSHFKILEDILGYFRCVFIAFQKGNEGFWRKSIPSRHIQPLAALAKFVFEKVINASAHINASQREDLEKWREDCLAFIKLHEFENVLRRENKSLFRNNPKFALHLENRRDLDLDTLRNELDQLDPHLITEMENETETQATKEYVPIYYQALYFGEATDYIECAEFIRERLKNWQHGPSIILINLFKRYFSLKELTSEMITTLNFAFNQLFSQEDSELRGYINEQFWQGAIRDVSPGASKVLFLVNHPELGANMREFLRLPSKEASPGEVSFVSLLEVCPACNLIFNDQDFNNSPTFECARFLRPWFRSLVGGNLTHAVQMNKIFSHKAADLLWQPLKGGGRYSLITPRENLGAIGPKEKFIINTNIVKMIQVGLLGSLDEIFGSMGLLEEFKEVYPTDESFWSGGEGVTFDGVYRNLKARKKAKKVIKTGL